MVRKTPRNIALFVDGTNNQPGGDKETNVWQLFEAALNRADVQVTCYFPGVGARDTLAVGRASPAWENAAHIRRPWMSRVSRRLARLLGLTSGLGTDFNIKRAYAFLCAHYDRDAQDRIYLFGFSRGALAVRSLAGFADEVGLLLATRLDYVEEAYRLYMDPDPEVRRSLPDFIFKLTGAPRPDADNRMALPIYFIGVWDTVGSLGIPGTWLKPDYHRTELPANVSHARHALALHDLRQWTFQLLPFTRCADRDVKQVWFAGAHADVGGGYAAAERGLSNVALNWMAAEAAAQRFVLDRKLPLAAENPLGPGRMHDEISAGGWLDIPRVRALLMKPRELERELLERVSVHPSALLRLGDRASLGYSFRRLPWWTRINTQLAEADRATLRLQLFLATRGVAPVVGGLLTDDWWQSASLEELQAADGVVTAFLNASGTPEDADALRFARAAALICLVMTRAETPLDETPLVRHVLSALGELNAARKREAGGDGASVKDGCRRLAVARQILGQIARMLPDVQARADVEKFLLVFKLELTLHGPRGPQADKSKL